MNFLKKTNGVKIVALIIIMIIPGSRLYSQKAALSTNIIDYAALATVNGSFSYALSRNLTMELSARYNPFTYKLSATERQMQNKRLALYTGLRYWPWHVYSGWFVAGNLNFTRFNMGGIFSQKTYEGDIYALAFGGGYALMLSPKFNIDFALSFLGGYGKYRRYACPSCGVIEAERKKVLLVPENIMVQISYLF